MQPAHSGDRPGNRGRPDPQLGKRGDMLSYVRRARPLQCRYLLIGKVAQITGDITTVAVERVRR